jgi:hypothetical protein
MEFGIFLLIIISILYFLLVKGYLWKFLIAGFGVYGIFIFLSKNIGCSNSAAIKMGDSSLSWAILIPLLIVMLAAAYTKME